MAMVKIIPKIDTFMNFLMFHGHPTQKECIQHLLYAENPEGTYAFGVFLFIAGLEKSPPHVI